MNNGEVRFWIFLIAVAAYAIGWLRGRWIERDKWEKDIGGKP